MPTTFEPPAVHAESATAERPPNDQRVRIVLVDRDSLARRAMREELTGTGELIVAAEAADADEALQSVRRERPDLVLIDIGYPLMSGIGVARELRSQQP